MISFFNRSKTIKNNIIFSSIFIFVVFMSVIGTVFSMFLKQKISEQIENNLEIVVKLKNNHIKTYFEESIENIKLITSRTKLRDSLKSYNQNPNDEDIETINGILQDALPSIQDIEKILIVDLNGQIIAATEQHMIGSVFEKVDIVKQARVQEKINLSRDNQDFKLFIAGPLLLDNELLGIAVTELNLDLLDEIVKDKLGLGETGEVAMAYKDEDGNLQFPFGKLSDSGDFLTVEQQQTLAKPMQLALEGQSRFFESALDYSGQEVIAFNSYIPEAEIGLVAKIDKVEAYQLINLINQLIVIFVFVYIILFYLIINFRIRSILMPLEKLTEGVEILSKGNYKYKIDVEGNNEITNLVKAFNKLSSKVDDLLSTADKEVKKRTRKLEEVNKFMVGREIEMTKLKEDLKNLKKKK